MATFTQSTSTPARSTRRKSPLIAAMLQGVPLIAAGSCIANGSSDQGAIGAAFYGWAAILFWGFGYLYAGSLARFAIAFLAGPVLAVAACTSSFSGVTYDYEHGPDPRHIQEETDEADVASLQTGIIVAIIAAFTMVDAARIAAARNARLAVAGD